MFSHLIFLRKSKHLIFSLSTQKEANTWFGRLKLFGSNGKKVKKAGRQNRITLFVMGKKEEIGVFYYTPLGPSPPTPGDDLFLEKNWHVLFFTILKPFLTLFKTPTEQYGFGDDGDGERAFLLCVGGIKIRGRGTIKLSAQILSITSQSKHKSKTALWPPRHPPWLVPNVRKKLPLQWTSFGTSENSTEGRFFLLILEIYKLIIQQLKLEQPALLFQTLTRPCLTVLNVLRPERLRMSWLVTWKQNMPNLLLDLPEN